MTASMWLGMVGFPLAAAIGLAGPEALRRISRAAALWAGVPAIAAAVWAEPGRFVVVPWLMLETRLGLDATGQVFLLLTGLLWTAGAIYARGYLRSDARRDRFGVFYLLAMAGNFGLVVTHDAVGFYLFFSLMTLAAFGLVVHDQTRLADFAGKLYIGMAILGEAILLAGILIAAEAAGDTDLAPMRAALGGEAWRFALAGVLLFVGFAIKAGVPLLHMWLPLAHPAAPTPASAVLSGAMIKAGVLGWIRFLPAGEIDAPTAGLIVMIVGLVGAFYGVVVGLAQSQAKIVLAYSSISQIGFMTVALGLGLARADAWPIVATTIALYALHHALAKGLLFLGVGVAEWASGKLWQRRALMGGLAIGALALAGAPMTSGFLAKSALKTIITFTAPGYAWLEWTLPLAALGTTVLMARFLYVVQPRPRTAEPHQQKRGLWPVWLGLLAAVVIVTWAAPQWYALELARPEDLTLAAGWANSWPVLAGIALALLGARYGGARNGWAWTIPPGDVLVLVQRGLRAIVLGWRGRVVPVSIESHGRLTRYRNRTLLKLTRRMVASEAGLLRWGTGGAMSLLIVVVLVLLLMGQRPPLE